MLICPFADGASSVQGADKALALHSIGSVSV